MLDKLSHTLMHIIKSISVHVAYIFSFVLYAVFMFLVLYWDIVYYKNDFFIIIVKVYMSVKAQKKKGLEKLSTRSKYAAIGGKDTKRELYICL